MADPTVGPHVGTEFAGGRGAFQDGGELRAADAGLHAGGAHGAGADADLDDVRTRRHQIAHAVGGDDVARHHRHTRIQRADALEGPDHRVLVAVGGVDDQGVGAGVEQRPRPALDVAVDAQRRAHPQAPVGVDGRAVQRGSQGSAAGEDARELALVVDHGRELAAGGDEAVEGLLRIHRRRQSEQGAAHQRPHLCEVVGSAQVLFRDQPDGHVPVDDDRGTVGALGQQVAGVAYGVVRLDGDRRLEHQVRRLDLADRLGGDVGRHVLRQDRHASAAGDGFRHSAAGHGGHVGHDQRNRGSRAIGGGQVHGHPGTHRRPRRDHEHVVVGELVRGLRVIEESHGRQGNRGRGSGTGCSLAAMTPKRTPHPTYA